MGLHKSTSVMWLGTWPLMALVAILAAPATGVAQPMPTDHSDHHPTTAPSDMSLSDQMAEMKAKVAKLEMELQHKRMGMADGSSDATKPMSSIGQVAGASMSGMGAADGMDKMAGMEMGGMSSQKGGMPNMMQNMGAMMQDMGGMMQKMPAMKGTDSMGAMNGGSQAQGGGMKGMAPGMKMDSMTGMDSMMGMPPARSMAASAALPGFPGASHLYHVGANDFFLDHTAHITLTVQQQSALNAVKEKALLDKATEQRMIDTAEQELWTLTASDQPDAAKIEAKIQEIEKLRGDQRLSLIRAVGEAAKVLTDEQQQSLLGLKPAQPTPAAPAMPGMPSVPAGAAAGGMGDM